MHKGPSYLIKYDIFSPVEDVVGVRPLVPDHSAQAAQGRVPELGEGGQLLQPGVDQVQVLKWRILIGCL